MADKIETRLKELRNRTTRAVGRLRPPVLVINGYAGSLTVAASQLGLNILGSFEDDGYGLNAQRHNFPDLTYVERYPWPAVKLDEALVIAHPPCAGFSTQSANSKSRKVKRGLGGTHFSQTKSVLDYALRLKPLAVMVESVQNAYEPTRIFYDELAATYGYHVYRVLQNAVTFGIPQWRPRFWAVLVRRDVAPSPFVLQHQPEKKCIAEVLAGVRRGEEVINVTRTMDRQLKKFKEIGFSADVIQEILTGEHGYGRVDQILPKSGLITEKQQDDLAFRRRAYHAPLFFSNNPVVLDPNGYAPVLQSNSIWMYDGRQVTATEYNAIMGYPHDYWFPKSEHLSLRSRGVCPPVARWLLEQVIANLTGTAKEAVINMTSVQALQPGETADFTVSRKDWDQKHFNFNPKPRPNSDTGSLPFAKEARMIKVNIELTLADVNEIETIEALIRKALPAGAQVHGALVSFDLASVGTGFTPSKKIKAGDKAPHRGKVEMVAAATGAKPVKVPKPAKKQAARKPRESSSAATRYRLLKSGDPYLKEILTPDAATHNAAVARALAAAGKTGLNFSELVANVKAAGWKTTSPNPESILRWHLGHLERERKLVERVS